MTQSLVHDLCMGQEIHKGRTTSVKLAKRIKLNETCAVKVIPATDPSNRAFFNDTVLLPLLNHRNIVHVADVVQAGGVTYQIMDHCEYGDLLHFLKTRVLPEQMAIKVIAQILAGVEYLHALGICHCDLRPENILLGKAASIQITGFTQASIALDKPVMGPVGSYEYSAPEATKTEAFDGYKGDMWSIGVLCFVIMTRKLPFGRDGKYEVVNWELVKNEQVKGMIRSLLSLDPSTRPTASQCLMLPLFADMEKSAPLGMLGKLNEDVDGAGMMASKLSQVTGIPVGEIRKRMSEGQVNPEKVLAYLYHVRHAGHSDRKAVFGKNGLVRKVRIFPRPGRTVYAAMTEFLGANYFSVSTPLGEDPVIVAQANDHMHCVSFSLTDDDEGNCVLMLASDTEGQKLSNVILHHLQEIFKSK